MPFSKVFQLHHSGQCTYPCFPWVLLTSTIFFPSHWLLSHITIVETTDSSERGMNLVAMTIINPRKEYWPSQGSNQRPPVLKSPTLPTDIFSFGPGRSGICLDQIRIPVWLGRFRICLDQSGSAFLLRKKKSLHFGMSSKHLFWLGWKNPLTQAFVGITVLFL